jgi:UDPglucose 6-dehydrogenase
MKIGIIGLGVVGKAVKYGMEKLGHKVTFYDPAYPESKWEDILDTEINFLCVPTPSKEDGSCDVSIVEETIQNLVSCKYTGIIVIKSTVTPGTTQRLHERFGFVPDKDNLFPDHGFHGGESGQYFKIAFVPEFLRERCAEIDFIENHDVCIIGTGDEKVYNKIKEAHGRYPRKFIKLTRTEAEFCKYFNNIYNATLVTFANSMYEVCKAMNVNYTDVKNAIVQRDHITDIYLDCNDNFRGFGGMCLPKDTKAIAYLAKELCPNVNFFETILSENAKYKTTVFAGMR